MHASYAAGCISSNHLNSGRWDRSSRIFPTTGEMGASSQKFAHSSHLEKKFPFPHGKIPQWVDSSLSRPTQHQIFISPSKLAKATNLVLAYWKTAALELQTALSSWIGGLGQGPNSQGNLQIRWYCLFWQILQVRLKKYSFEALQLLVSTSVDSFKVVLSNI